MDIVAKLLLIKIIMLNTILKSKKSKKTTLQQKFDWRLAWFTNETFLPIELIKTLKRYSMHVLDQT